jgi:hypothetical protein
VFSDRFWYELKLMGKKVTLTPMLVMVGFAALAILLYYLKVDPSRTLSAGLEMILPLMAGIVISAVTSQDQAIELQLTVPRKYHQTVMRRLAIILGWTAIVTLISNVIIVLLNLGYIPQDTPAWSNPLPFLVGQLTWIATLLWYVATGLVLGLLTRSRAASAAILCGIWIIEIIFKDIFGASAWLKPVFLFPTTLFALAGPIPQALFNYWLSNRFEVLAMGLVLLPIGWLLLRSPERLLKGSSEE